MAPLRWLQWSRVDLAGGLGGVEVFARSLNRELLKAGIQSKLSRDPRDLLDPNWDVIQMHGSAFERVPRTKAIRVQTLHGTTLGRMSSCGEWLWPGGYLAWLRELQGVVLSDVTLSVRPLATARLADKTGGISRVCWNGWDSSEEMAPLPQALEAQLSGLGSFWIYIGRGEDLVKGADRLLRALPLCRKLRLVAVPGSGFESAPGVIRSGSLSSPQVRALMGRAEGIVIPSRYEGNSLAMLEALAHGLRVLATRVGAAELHPKGVQGLHLISSADADHPERLAGVILDAAMEPGDRQTRAANNQKVLPRWADVARTAIEAVRSRLRAGSP